MKNSSTFHMKKLNHASKRVISKNKKHRMKCAISVGKR
jgi:hypothetical protein